MHATHDSRRTSAAGRRAFLDRFEREVDPDGTLPPAERSRRAEHARRAYFAGLALKSATARRKRRESSTSATPLSAGASAVHPAGDGLGGVGPTRDESSEVPPTRTSSEPSPAAPAPLRSTRKNPPAGVGAPMAEGFSN